MQETKIKAEPINRKTAHVLSLVGGGQKKNSFSQQF